MDGFKNVICCGLFVLQLISLAISVKIEIENIGYDNLKDFISVSSNALVLFCKFTDVDS